VLNRRSYSSRPLFNFFHNLLIPEPLQRPKQLLRQPTFQDTPRGKNYIHNRPHNTPSDKKAGDAQNNGGKRVLDYRQ
jgi:hypothetical protein